MIVRFDHSFDKSLDKIDDKLIKEKIKVLIFRLEVAKSISNLSAIKPMKGHPGFYRIRIGDYRVGFELTSNNEILLILASHRKDIYKRFP